MRPIRFLAVGIAVAMLVFATATYMNLPEQVPIHIDISGNVDRVAPRSFLAWFSLPLIGIAVYAASAFFGSRAAENPRWINIPGKDRLIALPKEYRGPVAVELRIMLEIIGIGVLLTIFGTQLLMWRASRGEATGAFILVPMASFLIAPIVLVWSTRISSAITRQEKLWKEELQYGRR